MDSELQSPYIESNSSTDTVYANTPRVSLQGVGNVPKKSSSIFNVDAMSLFISIIVTIIILYFIYTCYFGKTSLFTVTGDLSDPAHDEYLENQIDILNRMQEKNLRS